MKDFIMEDTFTKIERFLIGHYLNQFYDTEYDTSFSDQERLFIIDNIRVDAITINWKTIKKYWIKHYDHYINLIDEKENCYD